MAHRRLERLGQIGPALFRSQARLRGGVTNPRQSLGPDRKSRDGPECYGKSLRLVVAANALTPPIERNRHQVRIMHVAKQRCHPNREGLSEAPPALILETMD